MRSLTNRRFRSNYAAPGIAISAIALALVIGLSMTSGGASPADAAPTGFVIADTWASADAELPADAWRRARGIAIGSDSRIYVVDADELRLSVITPDGTATVLKPADGSTSGLRDAAHLAVDVDRNRIYVTDPVENVVAVFDLTGKRIDSWGGLDDASGVAVAPDGWVAAGSAETGFITLFETDGTKRLDFSTTTSVEKGDLVRGIDIDRAGVIHALDGKTQSLRTFNAAGRRLETIGLTVPGSVRIRDISVDYDPTVSRTKRYWFASSIGIYVNVARSSLWEVIPRGDLYAIDVVPAVGVVATVPSQHRTDGSQVLRYDHSAGSTSTPNTVWGGPVSLPGVFFQPEVIDLGTDGHAFVLDRARRVQRFTLDGAVVDQLDAPELTLNPVSVASAPDGTRYLTDGGSIAAYAADGTELFRNLVAVSDDEANAIAVAYDAGADQLIALDAGRDMLRRYGPDGTPLGIVAGERDVDPAPDGSTVWGDLALDAAGTVYALDRVNKTVQVVPRTGEQRSIILPARARHIAVAPDGTLHTIDRDGWVRRYDSAGVPDGAFDATRFEIALRSMPSDLAVGEDGSVYVSDREADLVTRFAPDADAEVTAPPDDAAECRRFPDKTASPSELELGGTVEVRLTVRGGCGSGVSSEPRDILLLLDRSGSMDGEKIRVLRAAAETFIADVDFATSRIGVISFNDTPRLDVGLTDDPARVRNAVRNLVAEGETLIWRGLAEARLEFGRRGRPGSKRVAILFSDGLESGSDISETRRQAGFLKRDDVEIFTIGIEASAALMRDVATDDEHYFAADSARFLFSIFERIAERVTTTSLFKEITVTDEIPSNMRFIPGSDEPPATLTGSTLTWTITAVPFGGFGVKYELEPLAVGDLPTNVEAWGDYIDGFGATGRLDFPVPVVRVWILTPTPTPTDTPTPTATPTPTNTPTPTATPHPINFPIALNEEPCEPGERHADVMLVIDASSSMVGEKIASAKAAADRFVELLDLPNDQIGVVAFASEAALVAPLSGDAATLSAAIAGLETASGTRIDKGIEMALEQLDSPAAIPGNTQVIVLLTDGRQPEVDELREAAAEARSRPGMRIYAVGLGEDVDEPLLAEVAGSADRVFLAAGPEDLLRIYTAVAGDVPCPKDVHWGKR